MPDGTAIAQRGLAMQILDEVMAKLAADSLLHQLPSEQLDVLLRSASRRDLIAGDMVINQGDENGDFAVFLLSGALKISLVSAAGREIILNYCSSVRSLCSTTVRAPPL